MKYYDFQRSIKKEIEFTGIGLHTGKKVKVKLVPLPPNNGIVFRKMNIGRDGYKIRASTLSIGNVKYSIDIESNGKKVRSVEHLLSALFSLGINNCEIQTNDDEIPQMDGSAIEFVKQIKKIGIKKYPYKRKILKLNKRIVVSLNDRYIIAFPNEKLKITTYIDFPNYFGKQIKEFEITPEVFEKEIAPAKTFGFLDQVKIQKRKGFIKGGNINSALIFTKTKLINQNIKQFIDEPVRHKMLDFLGALAFLEVFPIAHIIAIKPGHEIDVLFVKELEKYVS